MAWFKNKKTKEVFEVTDDGQIYDIRENIKLLKKKSQFKELKRRAK